jgi:hypothetical protein
MFRMRRILITIASAAVSGLGVTPAFGQFGIAWYAVAGGGAMNTTAGAFSLSGTAGQPDAGGAMTGGDFSLTGGFWFQVAAGDINADGVVDLLDYSAFNACLAGPDGEPGGSGCAFFDFDHDVDTDLNDFRELQILFSGGS